MACEVVVVGGGIGGLTAAALLAKRGFDVCLLERQSEVGGCLVGLEKFGYTFEPTIGLYFGWAEGEIFRRIFDELSVTLPELLPLNPAYVTRLPDGSEIPILANSEHFEDQLARVFPECAGAAVKFYRESEKVCDALLRALQRVPDLPSAGLAKRIYAFQSDLIYGARLLTFKNQALANALAETSGRFQQFIELQLQTFGETSLGQSAYMVGCVLLNLPRRNPVGIRGGAASLARSLAEAIKLSGGSLRLDTSVLRLSYDSAGQATGVDLLSGENLTASRAIVSNMTVWDTYGKLIGLERTPSETKKKLAGLQSNGAYLIYAGMDEPAAARLPADRILSGTDLTAASEDQLIDTSRFAFAAAPPGDPRGPQGMRAVTVAFPADVGQWFTFQADVSEIERRDQVALETGWQAIHKQLPQLGPDIEVIETATPQSYYDLTRRKLGMVGSLGRSRAFFELAPLNHRTNLPNVYMVGDTVFPGGWLAGACLSGLTVALEIIRE